MPLGGSEHLRLTPRVVPDKRFAGTTYIKDDSGVIVSSRSILGFPGMPSFTSAWRWSEGGYRVDFDSADDEGLWTNTHWVVVTPPPPQRLLDEEGRQELLRVDTDADGTFDVEHLIRYTGAASCLEHHRPSLKDLGMERDSTQIVFSCVSPLPPNLYELYGIEPPVEDL